MEQVAEGASIAAAEALVDADKKDKTADGLGGIAPEGVAMFAAVDSHKQHLVAGWGLSVPQSATRGCRDPFSLLVSRRVFADVAVSAVLMAAEAVAVESSPRFLNCLTSEAYTVKLSGRERRSAHFDIGRTLVWDLAP